MSALARLLRAQGAVVAGSDMLRSDTTEALSAEGIPVSLDQSADALPAHIDSVIASAAVPPDHPQLLQAGHRGLPRFSYAQALGCCMADRTGVAIAGTHGKSTTAAMLTTALVDAGLDPSAVVGATCAQLQYGALHARPAQPCGWRLGAPVVPAGPLAGRPGLLIAEACEYRRSFHHLRPRFAAITAVEPDHLDVYRDLDDIIDAFASFARQLPPADDGGLLLIAHNGAHRQRVARNLPCRVETIGLAGDADWIVQFDPATSRVQIARRPTADQPGPIGPLASWHMLMPGAHNALNAATAFALACSLGADPRLAAASLDRFAGLDRRCQWLGLRPLTAGGAVSVYDDYGHHPTEVAATLRALRDAEQPHARAARLICVFQPHQHSRTRFLLEQFAGAFADADLVVVPHIYFVRDSEAERRKVSAADLVARLQHRGVEAHHIDAFDDIVAWLDSACRPGDVLVVMGAGPVWKIARDFLARRPSHVPEPLSRAG